jgi:putative membrane protein
MLHPEAAPHVEWWTPWTFDPLVLATLVASAAVYGVGLTRLWRTPAGRRAVPVWHAVAWTAGWGSIVVALLSPLDRLSDILFSAHMTQHELLMLVGAPLIVVGRPLVVMLWAFAPATRERVGRLTQAPLFEAGWRGVTGPIVVWILHAVVLWAWHAPALYEAALADERIHAVQHLSFFVTAALFWWAVVHGRYGRGGYGVAVLYVFTTALHSGALGALFTFAGTERYPAYDASTRAWGADPLADQALAGLIMWIPFGLVFMIVGLALFAAWLGESDRRLGRASPGTLGRVSMLLIAIGLGASGCEDHVRRSAEQVTGGNPDRAPVAMRKYGCTSCHSIPGVPGAHAYVGPPLDGFRQRSYIAGHLDTDARTLVRWIRHPHSLDGRTAMPEMGVTDQDARDMAAYLYTLR